MGLMTLCSRLGFPLKGPSRCFSVKAHGLVGSANLDWTGIGFTFQHTAGHSRFLYRDGAWDQGRFLSDPHASLHILSCVFHTGQAVFEGLKAYHQMDGSVAVFADGPGYDRICHSMRSVDMPEMSRAQWETAIDQVIWGNLPYIPPFESGCSLYIRPNAFGMSPDPEIMHASASEYMFNITVCPVASYFKAGSAAMDGIVLTKADRVAPCGLGSAKAALNYASDLVNMRGARERGFNIHLYLDPIEKRYIEEFNTSNFVAITKDGTYITPDSPSVLKSITNRILMKLAKDEYGLKVERRPIDFEKEVDTFVEVGAVGTAVIVNGITSLTLGEKTWKFQDLNVLAKLRLHLENIQRGVREDKYGFKRTIVGSGCDTLENVRKVVPTL